MDERTVDWGELLFSSAGRLTRTPFLILSASLLGAGGLYDGFVGAPWHDRLAWLVYPSLLFCGACVLCKRLHDRGHAGWWAGPILLALLLVWPYPRGPIGFMAMPVLVWAVAELALQRGVRGHNGYGPEPGRARGS